MSEPSRPESPEEAGRHARARWIRLGLLGGVLIVLLGVGRAFGAHEYLTAERLRLVMESAGIWAVPLYWIVFCLGELAHVPGIVFVAGACAAYDWGWAYLLAMSGALASATFSFFIVRGIAGRALADMKSALLQRILAQVDRRPVSATIVLRLIFWMAPQLNYGLALTRIRYRDYLVGSAIGLAPPVLGIVVFFEWLFEQDVATLIRTCWPYALVAVIVVLAALVVWRLRVRKQTRSASREEA